MTSDNAVSAAATPAANGFGDTHSTAGFKALTLGSIGVVYGDIGTSPLYALREAVVASGATGEARRARKWCWVSSRRSYGRSLSW